MYDVAIKDFTKVIESNKEFVRAYCHRGVAYFEMGKFDKALNDCEKALELDPTFESKLRPFIDEAKEKIGMMNFSKN